MKQTNVVTFILAFLFVFVFAFFCNKGLIEQEHKIKKLEATIDSLESEIHSRNIILGRYEIGIFEYSETHPKETKQLMNIILNETE